MNNLPSEYEAKFIGIDKEDIRSRLKAIGAELVRSEFIQKRIIFNLPSGHEIKNGRVRVRDEGNKITMSIKISGNQDIEEQKEICLEVDSFDQALLFLSSIGCERKAYIETKRELWKLSNAQITIDEWPFLDPYIEIESNSEESVKEMAKKLDLDYTKAMFGSASQLYNKKYGVSEDTVNNCTPNITFAGNNPFLGK